jgi:CheY-like chemotaxis protein
MFHTLVVDDTREKRGQLEEVLVDALGLPVTSHRSAVEGLAHIREQAAEVVAALIDYSFPAEELKGTELIRALRSLNARCYIALVTSHPQKSSEFTVRKGEAAIAGATETYSTNMLPYNAYDWIYLELQERKQKLLTLFGLGTGSPDHS